MRYSGFHHIGLSVRDAQKSLAFYTEGLGGKEVFRFAMGGDPSRIIYLIEMGPGAVMEIIPNGTGEPESAAKWAHIALETSDARAAFESAVAAGAIVKSAPADMMLGTMAVVNAFVYGPEGETIEFFEVKA